MLKACRWEEGRLIAGGESCGAVIFPYCEYLPGDLLDWCADAAGRGVRVLFLEGLPRDLETGEKFRCPEVELISEERLVGYLREMGLHEICCEPKAPELRPKFSGVMEYETHFDLPEDWGRDGEGAEERESVELDFGEVYETMEVWLNGVNLGVRIAPPYRVYGNGALRARDNVLKVRVVNTLVHACRDFFSATMPTEPSGLLGPVSVKYR